MGMDPPMHTDFRGSPDVFVGGCAGAPRLISTVLAVWARSVKETGC
jgi:hypothetical protein